MKFNFDDDVDDNGANERPVRKNLKDLPPDKISALSLARHKFAEVLRDMANRLDSQNEEENAKFIQAAVLTNDGSTPEIGSLEEHAKIAPESFVTNTLADLWLHIEEEADPEMFLSSLGLAVRLISMRIGMPPSETVKALSNGLSNPQLDF